MTDEFDPINKCISIDSPVARALMSKLVDEEITVKILCAAVAYWIVAINCKPLD
ncbi:MULTISPECIES: GreA/GreB family elongation factor [Photorhabdus]